MEASWRPLGALEKAWSAKASRGVWGALGRLFGPFGPPKTLLGSALGRPKGTKETGFELPGDQMGAPKGPRRVLKLAPKANQVENVKTTKIADGT